ncbi:MAG: helix-turn-helix domain-containing protein [Thermoleophilia bacterium]
MEVFAMSLHISKNTELTTSPERSLTLAKWTTAETAVFLNLSERTLCNWRWRGVGPNFLKLCGAVRYDPEHVREWQARQERTSTSDRPDAR